MSHERSHDHLPYWTDDGDLGLHWVGHARRLVHVRSHSAVERQYGPGHETLLTRSRSHSERTYLQSRLYVLAPPETRQQFPVASTQSWYYPHERAIVFWECVLEPRYEPSDPREGLLLRSLWSAYERMLVQRFPLAERLVTTWDDTYNRNAWRGLLTTLGYRHTAAQTFTKPVPAPGNAPA